MCHVCPSFLFATRATSSDYNVVVVSEETLGITREVGYANSKAEKITRSSLKAAGMACE
jgi:hypothetical protein